MILTNKNSWKQLDWIFHYLHERCLQHRHIEEQYEAQVSNQTKTIAHLEDALQGADDEKHGLLQDLAGARDLSSQLEATNESMQRQMTAKILEQETVCVVTVLTFRRRLPVQGSGSWRVLYIFPVSCPFLADVPDFHVLCDSVFPVQLWSSSRALHLNESSFRQLLGCFLFHLFLLTCPNHSDLRLLMTIAISSTFAYSKVPLLWCSWVFMFS